MDIRGLLKHVEMRYFFAGIFMLVMFVVFMVFVYLFNEGLFYNTFTMLVMDIFGGRSTGMSYGMENAIPMHIAVIVSASQDLIILYLILPLITIFSHKLKHDGFLKWTLDRAFDNAKKQKEKLNTKLNIIKYIVVIVFVWVPFFMTGTLVGFILAVVLGISINRSLVLVTFATIFGAASWAFAFKHIIAFMNSLDKSIPMIFIIFILSLAIMFNIINYTKYYKEKSKR